MPIDGWMDKQNVMEYGSTLKRKENLSQATIQINFKDITVPERSQSQENKSCMIPLTWDL